MKTGLPKKSWVRILFRLLLPIGFLLVLISLLGGRAIPVKADAGGWPTNTPTATIPATPTATFTPIPTSALLPFPIFATPTPTQGLGVLSGNPSQPNFALQAPAPTPQPSGFSLLSCWPFAVLAIIVIIIIVWWLRNRVLAQVP